MVWARVLDSRDAGASFLGPGETWVFSSGIARRCLQRCGVVVVVSAVATRVTCPHPSPRLTPPGRAKTSFATTTLTGHRFVRLEELCWVLEPERLCVAVTGEPWKKYEARRDGSGGDDLKLRFTRQHQLANYFVNQVRESFGLWFYLRIFQSHHTSLPSLLAFLF